MSPPPSQSAMFHSAPSLHFELHSVEGSLEEMDRQPPYDALNRARSLTHPDNSVDSMSPVNNQTTITDPSGVKRIIQNDAAGRTTSVTEYPAVGGTWVTSYTYDGLDDLIGVNQSGQTCSFVYDSLKRLTSATNPETSANGAQSGTISYTYDANSNLTKKTDARRNLMLWKHKRGLRATTQATTRSTALSCRATVALHRQPPRSSGPGERPRQTSGGSCRSAAPHRRPPSTTTMPWDGRA